MTRAEKAERIQKILAKLYPLPPIPLQHEDPYTLLLAVVLSAQCTDVRVNQVTPRLFARARTPDAMARLAARDIQAIIKSCGLAPAKARHIRELSRILVERHGGVVPGDFEALEALPGVGHKTASVVMAQAFGQPAFPVDTHIHRLAARWGLSTGRNVTATERDLKAALRPGRLEHAASPDDLLRARALPGARPRPRRMRDLLVVGVQGPGRPRAGTRGAGRPAGAPPRGARPTRRAPQPRRAR